MTIVTIGRLSLQVPQAESEEFIIDLSRKMEEIGSISRRANDRRKS